MYRMGWTGERMDDFAKHTDQRFDAVDKRLDRLDDRFAALQRTLLLMSGGIIAALIGLIATQL
jgi:DNA anti-recombination protein RmuC